MKEAEASNHKSTIRHQPTRAPQRTCISCRRKDDQRNFWRVARAADGRISEWAGHGRSAYICQTTACLEAAISKGRLERALKGHVNPAERAAIYEVLRCKLR